MEQYTPRLKYEKVLWEFPPRGWIKVNTDGACRGNPRRSSIGFCIRDKVGDLIYAKGREISEGTNNESKTVAIVEALKMCKNLNYFQIWLQTDSLLLKNIIEESWKPPWCINDHVEEILRLNEQSIIKVTHIFREGNTLADHLANYALDEGNIECHGFWDMDSKGRRIINEDKMQCPYIRVKVASN
uniref:Ribonuclease H-like n=1 Tax=Nicotiana tabacum TaxID=4097 RepID=A0A1S3YGK7_TOBAC|nr:PREDICTED: ribonuclease H-like [Nicotiana tabacum]